MEYYLPATKIYSNEVIQCAYHLHSLGIPYDPKPQATSCGCKLNKCSSKTCGCIKAGKGCSPSCGCGPECMSAMAKLIRAGIKDKEFIDIVSHHQVEAKMSPQQGKPVKTALTIAMEKVQACKIEKKEDAWTKACNCTKRQALRDSPLWLHQNRSRMHE